MPTRFVRKTGWVLALLLLVALAIAPSVAQRPARAATSSGPTHPQATTATYDLPWWTVDGGGVSASAGGSYTLSSTTGQPDAGLRQSGGAYTLQGGFWMPRTATPRGVFLPVVMRRFHSP